MTGLRRRTILGLLAGLPALLLGACKKLAGKDESAAQETGGAAPAAAGTDPAQEPFRTLVRIVGPWPAGQEDRADAFTTRLLASDPIKPLLARAEVGHKLAASLSGYQMAAADLDLSALAADERKFLLDFTAMLYSLNEIRYAAAGVPMPGTCLGGNWHTNPPA
jgi:hypothetical protein